MCKKFHDECIATYKLNTRYDYSSTCLGRPPSWAAICRVRPATLSMSRHLSTLNYLRSADTCLKRTVIYWLSVPATTDSVNRCCVFGGHFNPKSLAHTLTCDQQLAQYFPCCRLVTTSNSCVMSHMTPASQHWRPLATFVLRHHVVKVTSSVFNPWCGRRERFLVWTSELMCCAVWMECIV